jgi:hypothetical protein
MHEVFEEAQTFEVIHIDGTRFHKGKVGRMTPKDRRRLRTIRKISHNPPEIVVAGNTHGDVD